LKCQTEEELDASVVSIYPREREENQLIFDDQKSKKGKGVRLLCYLQPRMSHMMRQFGFRGGKKRWLQAFPMKKKKGESGGKGPRNKPEGRKAAGNSRSSPEGKRRKGRVVVFTSHVTGGKRKKRGRKRQEGRPGMSWFEISKEKKEKGSCFKEGGDGGPV